MSAKDIVQKFIDSANRGDTDGAIGYCADDMQFVGPAPKALGKNEFRSMMKALHDAFPDWNFHASNLRDTGGDKCTCTFEITGTQKGDLSLPFTGMQTVRATGKTIHMPKEQPEFTVTNGKISRLQVNVGPDGGLMGIMKQLGAPMPQVSAGGRPSAPSHP